MALLRRTCARLLYGNPTIEADARFAGGCLTAHEWRDLDVAINIRQSVMCLELTPRRTRVKRVLVILPATGADVPMFIDATGMPLTPLSFAGDRRRAYRWAFMVR